MTNGFNNITPWAKLPSAGGKTKLGRFTFIGLGDIIIDDVGFKPKVVIFFAGDNSSGNSIGIGDGTQQSVMNITQGTISPNSDRIIFNGNPARSNVRLVELNDNGFKLNVFHYSGTTVSTNVFYLAIG